METAGTKILPYSIDLKSVLLTIFHVDNASDVRAAIFPILTQVGRTRSREKRRSDVVLADGIVRGFEQYAE